MASSPEFRPDIEYAKDCIMASEMLTSLPPAERDLVMKETINPELKEIHESFPPEVILLGLMDLSTKITTEGETATHLELCTEYVGDNIVEKLNDKAETANLNWDFTAFAIWQQMYEGACDTITEIQMTGEFQEEGVDGFIAQLINDAAKFEEPLSPNIITATRIVAQRNFRLLKEDPTGFLLADDLISQSIQANREEFYIDGVMLAVARYKEAYTIAQLHRL